MNRMTSAWGIMFCVAGLAWAATAMPPSGPEPKPPAVDPASLHPERSIVFLQWDGSKAHAEAIKKTAQYQALVESGLTEYVTKLVEQSLPAVMAQVAGPRASANEIQAGKELMVYLSDIMENGLSFSITDGAPDGPPMPVATLVFHEFAGSEAVFEQLLDLMDIPVDRADSKLISRRSVKTLIIPQTPGFELSWFSEGDHLVVTVGPNASASVIEIASGNAANVTTSNEWKTYRGPDVGFEVASVSWIQFAPLVNRFGEIPLPIPGVQGPRTVNHFVDALGLDNLEHAASVFGYKDEACMTRTTIVAPGERRGLLALLDQPTFTMEDLPPIPADANVFMAFSLDAAAAYDTTLETAERVLSLLPPEAAENFAQGQQMLAGILGLDIRDDLMAPLGNVHCIYSDPSGGFFGFGFGAAFGVSDAARLEQSVNHLANLIQRQLDQEQMDIRLGFQRSKNEGHNLLTFPASIWAPTIGFSDEWMVVGIQPQSVRTFFMRDAGTMPKWQPNAEHSAALALLPKEFSSVAIDDPRASMAALYNFVPMVNSMIHTVAPSRHSRNMVTAADLPPVEFVKAPLFANVSVGVPSENGITYIRRQSLPIGPMPSVESGAAVPVLIGLLLPAVQQAREAARRTQSKNNIKQIGLAMHNYHDVFNSFPAGTVEGTDLKPDERLSFFYSILPFLEQQNLYEGLRASEKQPWDSPQAKPYVELQIPSYSHPSSFSYIPGATNYVGISGVGPNAADLRHNDPKAGIFGNNRKTRIRDITDGTSNTLMISEASDGDIPWAQGSRTLRGFSQQPYINGPDGIGGPSPGGCNMGLADGSVRFVSEYVDPSIMEALATKAGGEVVGGF